MVDICCSFWCERVFLSSAAVSEERPALSKRVLLTLAVAQSICVALFHVLLEQPSARTHTHTHTHTHTNTHTCTQWASDFNTSISHSLTSISSTFSNNINKCSSESMCHSNNIMRKWSRDFWSFTKAGWIAMKSGSLLLFNPRSSSERFIISQMREIHWNETELRWDQNLVKNHKNTSNTFQDSWRQVKNWKTILNQLLIKLNHIQQNLYLTV